MPEAERKALETSLGGHGTRNIALPSCACVGKLW